MIFFKMIKFHDISMTGKVNSYFSRCCGNPEHFKKATYPKFPNNNILEIPFTKLFLTIQIFNMYYYTAYFFISLC